MNFKSLVTNVLTMRQAWLRKLLDPAHDIEKECGHPVTISPQDYSDFFSRGDVASRVVKVLPEESWCESPEIYETDNEEATAFEEAWDDIEERHKLYSMLERADVLSGIGRFGILLLGVDDGAALEKPLTDSPVSPDADPSRKLLYTRAFDESLVTVDTLESDITNPRYGQPVLYSVQFADTTGNQPASSTTGTTSAKIHWTRVIHLADNRTTSDVYGVPRMEVVYNRLLDLRKIAGSSSEMFWKGGFPGLSLEAAPGLEDQIEFDEESMKKQMDAYQSGLQRYIAIAGLQAKSLAPQVADPRPHVEVQLRLIATALGVPWRVLIGSEAAQLASDQDARSWNRRLARRREKYIDPFILRPLIDRLIAIGVLPTPVEDTYEIEWPDLNSPSNLDKSTVSERRTNALSKYIQGGVDALIPPFYYLTLVLGMTDDEAHAVLDNATEDALLIDRMSEPDPTGANGKGSTGPAPRRQTSAGDSRVSDRSAA